MSTWRDLESEMRRRSLDERTIGRLVSGHLDPDDAPQGYSEVARLMRALAGEPSAEELAGRSEAIDAALSEIDRAEHPALQRHRRAKLPGSWPARLVGAVAVATLLMSGGLAFAGALPAAVQRPVSQMFSHVGISVPSGEPAGKGAEISRIATAHDPQGIDKGAAVSSLASDGRSRAGTQGAASAAPGQDAGATHATGPETSPIPSAPPGSVSPPTQEPPAAGEGSAHAPSTPGDANAEASSRVAVTIPSTSTQGGATCGSCGPRQPSSRS